MNIDVPCYIAHRREGDGATQSLEAHLLGVANIAGLLAAKLRLNEQGEFLGLLHDLGKYSGEFQTYLQSAVGLINPDEDDYVDARGLKGKVDHSTAGAQLVWEELSKQGNMGRIVGQILGLCIASHHSGLIDCLSSDTNRPVEDMFTKRISKQDDRTHLREAMSKMDPLIEERFRELVGSPGLIDGLKESIRQVILRDDIKGLDPSKNEITQFKLGLLVRFLFSCLIDADRVDTADFERPKAAKHRLNRQYTEWPQLIERLEKHLQGFGLRNSVDETIYRLCREEADIPAYHLSTNMCPAHRKEILSQIRKLLVDECPVLCVSTQLIEAGVDVDFGAVIRYTAGLDSIAQAAGRCNRNGRRETGRVHVVNPAVESVDMLKDIQCGKNVTERLLDDAEAGLEDFGGNLLGPKAMGRYFDCRRQER